MGTQRQPTIAYDISAEQWRKRNAIATAEWFDKHRARNYKRAAKDPQFKKLLGILHQYELASFVWEDHCLRLGTGTN